MEGLAAEVLQYPGFGGEVEAEVAAVEGLAGLVVAAVDFTAAVFAVAQEGAADVGQAGADLVGAAGEKLGLHQAQLPAGLYGAVEGDGGLAAGDGAAVDLYLVFGLVLQEKALDAALGRVGAAYGDAEVSLGDLAVSDLVVQDAQGLGGLGGDDDAAGVSVDPVAEGLPCRYRSCL